MNNDIQYVAKQIINMSKKHKVISITCLNKKDAKVKNDNFKKISDILSDSDFKFITVNYDSEYSDKTDVDATDVCTNLSYNFNKIDTKTAPFVLVNLKPIIGFEALLDQESDLNKIVLSTKYGKTSLSTMEKGMEILKNNNSEIIGVIANKR